MVPNVPLGEILTLSQYGLSVSSVEGGQYPMFKMNNFNNGFMSETGVDSVDLDDGELEKYKLEYGDLLFNRTNSIDLVGKTGVFTLEGDYVFASYLIRLKVNGKVADPFFLNYFMNFDATKLRLKSLATKAVSQANINPTQLKKLLKVPLFPISEQRKIAKILSTWDKAIATTEKLIASSKQQKKALMQQLLTGKKRLLNPETGKVFEGERRESKTPFNELPSDWSEITLQELSSFITKGSTPTTYGFEWQEAGIPFLRSECVGKDGFKESGINYICDAANEAMTRSKVFPGDILITITGNVGRVCKLPSKFSQANINQHIAKVTIQKSDVCGDFIFHCLRDSRYRTRYEKITTGQAYPQISLVQIRETVVPIPPIWEQQKIASVLTAADKEIELLDAKLAHLKQEKKALMQQLLTGKRRGVEANTEAA